MHGEPQDPWLLTPGPLTTATGTKEAMLHDWGSRDETFIDTNRRLRERLLAVVNAAGSHDCIPLQGSGTFAVEAALGSLVPRDGKCLVLVNGAYGRRMAKILDVMGRARATEDCAEDVPCSPEALDRRLAADPEITHVAAVHCETTSGIVNPVAELAAVAHGHGKGFLIDSMSAFGVLDLDAATVPFDAVMASSNKGLEGVPGLAFVIARKQALAAAQDNAHSLSLDLVDQLRGMEANGQWRFTPPTHVLFALAAAMDRFEAEGGVAGRRARYAENCRTLVEGMRDLGFQTLLPDDLQAPVIVTFLTPVDPNFAFPRFYEGLKSRGYVIYPGKLTEADSFRMGCIGALEAEQMRGAVAAVQEVLVEMGVSSGAPAD